LLVVESISARALVPQRFFERNKFILLVSRNTALDLLRSVSTISASRGDRRLINATLHVSLADVESRLGVTNTQLSVASRDLAASKILLSETQQALSNIEDSFAIEKQEHL
jgi:hypothetical protein